MRCEADIKYATVGIIKLFELFEEVYTVSCKVAQYERTGANEIDEKRTKERGADGRAMTLHRCH